MTLDDASKAALGLLSLVAGALIAAVAKLFDRVRKNREDSVAHAQQLATLKAQVDNQLTTEQVRSVLDDALAKRDQIAAERRQRWDELLTMRVRQAVAEGVQDCQRQTREELDELLPRALRRALEETSRHRLPPATETP